MCWVLCLLLESQTEGSSRGLWSLGGGGETPILTVTLTQYEVASVWAEGLLWKDKAWVTEVGGGRGGCPSQGRPHLWAVHHTPHQVQ